MKNYGNGTDMEKKKMTMQSVMVDIWNELSHFLTVFTISQGVFCFSPKIRQQGRSLDTYSKRGQSFQTSFEAGLWVLKV